MKITFFDTETTGTPLSYKLPPEKYPRIVSLAFVQTNEGKVFKTMHSIVRPEGFEIPEKASAIHGITTDHGFGKPQYDHLKRFLIDVVDIKTGMYDVQSYQDFHTVRDAIIYALKGAMLVS